MEPRTQNMNGKSVQKQDPSQNEDHKKVAFKDAPDLTEHLSERLKRKSFDLQRQASSYMTYTDDYARRHPWRIAITASVIGLLAGALIARRKNN